ncbi:elongin-A-like [Ctenocephalides felis]|uniref:elongin-A-like n=1 Tax=Ctenocephalides felis TaxID=7515 RepID=UPI000E6E255D|nr:elongin-A-like [Ctenocephalides felis]
MRVNCKSEHPANYSKCSALINYKEKRESDALRRTQACRPAPTPVPLTRSFSSALNTTSIGPNVKSTYPQLPIPPSSFRHLIQSSPLPVEPTPSSSPIRPALSQSPFRPPTSQSDPDFNNLTPVT